MGDVEHMPNLPGVYKVVHAALRALGHPVDLTPNEVTRFTLEGRSTTLGLPAVMALNIARRIDEASGEERTEWLRQCGPQLVDLLREIGGAEPDEALWAPGPDHHGILRSLGIELPGARDSLVGDAGPPADPAGA